jgi:hypothetical protein
MPRVHDYVRSRTDIRLARGYLESPIHPVPRKHTMLYTIAVVLLILWVLGLVSSYTIGGLIHILLVVAVVMILVNFISGRRVL